MKLFAQGPDISDAEDEDSDVNQAKEGPPETVDAKRLKRREKKRKANAKKLAKKYAALGVEPPAPGPAPTKKQRKAEAESKPIAAGKPGTVASKGAQKGAGKGHESESSDWPSSSDEEDEPERTKQTTKPAVAPPKSFFDPFAKKRIAAAPAAVEKLTNCRNLTAPNKTKPVSENGGDSSSTSSSSSDSESSEEPAKPAKAAAPQSFFDPFSKKRIVVGQGGGGGESVQKHSRQGGATHAKNDASSSGNEIKKPKAAKKRAAADSESESSSSEDDVVEQQKKPASVAAGPKTVYDPFSTKRIVVQPSETGEEKKKGGEELKGKAKGKKRTATQRTPSPTSSESSGSDSGDSSEDEAGNLAPKEFAPPKFFDPFATKKQNKKTLTAPSASGENKSTGRDNKGAGGGQLKQDEARQADIPASAAQRGSADTAADAAAATQECIIFVGQLPYTATKAEIGRHFAACQGGGLRGVKSVRLLTDKATGKSRGMAFVEFPHKEAVEEAIKAEPHLTLLEREPSCTNVAPANYLHAG